MNTTLFEVAAPGRLAPYEWIDEPFADKVCRLATAHVRAVNLMFTDRPALEEEDFDYLADADEDTREWSRLCRRVGRDDTADVLLEDLGKGPLPCPSCLGLGLVTVAPFTDVECEDCRGEGYR